MSNTARHGKIQIVHNPEMLVHECHTNIMHYYWAKVSTWCNTASCKMHCTAKNTAVTLYFKYCQTLFSWCAPVQGNISILLVSGILAIFLNKQVAVRKPTAVAFQGWISAFFIEFETQSSIFPAQQQCSIVQSKTPTPSRHLLGTVTTQWLEG